LWKSLRENLEELSGGISWGDAPRFDVAGLQPVGESRSLKGSNTKD